LKIRSPLLTNLAARLAVMLLRMLFWTCRIRIHETQPATSPYAPTGEQRYLYSIWHDQLILSAFCKSVYGKMAGLVSRHQDGSYLADAMKLVHIEPVRGSSSRGGDRAMRELMSHAQDKHISITPDGPRGPRREAKPGIVFLASYSGRAIIPVAFSCRSSWRIQGSWTDMEIPKPFSTVDALGGDPFSVPSGLDRAGINYHLSLLQEQMDALQCEVEQFRSRSNPVQGDQPGESAQRKAA